MNHQGSITEEDENEDDFDETLMVNTYSFLS